MLSAVCIGTKDTARARSFHDGVLGSIGMTRIYSEADALGYAGSDGLVTVSVVTPFDDRPATAGNGTQVDVQSPDVTGIRAVHAAALAQGGFDEDAPGPRRYHPDDYGACVRDPDGNKLHVRLARSG